MTLTLLTIAALASELHENLVDGIIIGVYPLVPAGVRLRVQKTNQTCSLCVPAHPDFFFPFLCTHAHLGGPESPFVRHLRRLLNRSTITSVSQWRDDRILRVEFSRVDEILGARRRVLILELVPRRQNLILIDLDRELILEVFRRVTRRMSRLRLIRPGQPYKPPPELRGPQLRLDSPQQFLQVIRQFPKGQLGKTVARLVPLTSPYLLGELWPQIEVDPNAPVAELDDAQLMNLWKVLVKWAGELESWPERPTLVLDKNGHGQALLPYEPKAVPSSQKRTFTSLSQGLEHIFLELREQWALQSERKAVGRIIHRAVHRNRTILRRLEADLANARRAEEFRRLGEIISANIGHLKKGLSQARLANPYSPRGDMIQVSLDPKLSPAENAQRYFKRFRKAKAGLPKIQGRLSEVRTQLKELESLKRSLQAVSKKEKVENIAARLVQLGLRAVPTSPRRSGRGKKPASRPLTIALDQGWTILVGRNNRENDLLTHMIARPGDLWFHAQGVPGSHVILRREERKAEPSKRILEEAASVAAYFSRARHSKTVPVVYTEKRYVRKPKGAKPGSAVVEREKTLFVKPKLVGRDEEDHK